MTSTKETGTEKAERKRYVHEDRERKEEGSGEKRRVQKQYKFQGVRKHKDVLKECTDKIKEIEEKVTKYKGQIDAQIQEFRKSTGQKELYDEKETVQKRIEELQKEKNEMVQEVKNARQELRTMSMELGEEKKKLNIKSAGELKGMLQAIENRIREKPLSHREETEISTEKNRLVKLLSMQDIFKEKDEKLKHMEDEKKVKETLLGVKKQEIDLHYEKLTETNNKIAKIKKTVYPEEIKNMQQIVSELIGEKKAMIEKKKEEIAVMEKKAQEYEQKSAEIEKAKELKNAIAEQEKILNTLKKRRNSADAYLHGNIVEKLKSLKITLEMHIESGKKEQKGASTLLPFHVVNELLQYGIAIPRMTEKMGETIKQVEKAAKSEEEKFMSKKDKLIAEIAELDEKIQTEGKKLSKMPKPVFPRFESEERSERSERSERKDTNNNGERRQKRADK